ncbi:hypothetical protein MYU51_012597 [Penicillium brevicompactum]
MSPGGHHARYTTLKTSTSWPSALQEILLIEARFRIREKPSPELESTGVILAEPHTITSEALSTPGRYAETVLNIEDVQEINTLFNGHRLIDSSELLI